ncbi:MAG: GlsB/YeaQ/YmgE family stress response membrane protein [Ktedonobacteraceae bacterium]
MASMVLAFAFLPGSIIAWLVVGLIAGAVGGMLMRGSGFGIGGDLVVGLIGALIGGFLASLLGFSGSGGLIGSIVVAIIGACILIAILHAVGSGRHNRSTL